MSDYYHQLEPAIKVLEGLIKKYKKIKNVEIEIKLGRIDDKFIAGIHSESFYDKIKNSLDSYSGWDSVNKEHTVNYIKDSYRKTGNNIIHKERLESINFNFKGTPYDFRICVSTETPDNLKSFKHSLVRRKNRISYVYNEYKLDCKPNKTENITCKFSTNIDFTPKGKRHLTNRRYKKKRAGGKGTQRKRIR